MQDIYPEYDILKIAYRDRLPDQFAATQLNQVNVNGKKCLIVNFITIPSPWHHANELGLELVNSTVREFLRSDSPSLLIKFESALKALNFLVASFKNKLNAHLDCLTLLICGKQVHFSSIGSPSVAIKRHGKFINIATSKSEQSQGSDVFTTVTSGDLQDGEWLIIGNRNLLDNTLKALPETVWQQDLQTLKQALGVYSTASRHQAINGCCLRFNQGSQGNFSAIIWEELEPAVPIKLSAIELLSILSFKERASSLTNLLLNLARKLKKIKPVFPKTLPINLSNVKKRLQPITFRNLTPKKFPLKQLLIAILGVSVIVAGFFIVRDRLERSRREITKTIYEQWQDSSPTTTEVALNFLINNFNQQQFDSLSDADKEKFLNEVRQAGITPIISLKLISELPEDIAAIDQINEVLFAVDRSGQLWRYKNNIPTKIEQVHPITNPISLIAASEEKILVSDRQSNIWYFDLAVPPPLSDAESNQTPARTELPKALTAPSAISAGRKLLAKFSSNVYLYHPDSRSIFRVTNFNGNLDRATRYNSGDILNSTEFTSFAINGSIIGVDRTGLITKFRTSNLEARTNIAATSGDFHLSSNTVNSDWFVAKERTIWRFNNNNAEVKSVSFIFSNIIITQNLLSTDGKELLLASGRRLYLINTEQL